jgi:hypothetical protein
MSGAALRALRELEEAREQSGSTALLASLDLFGVGYIGREGDMLRLYTVASEIPDVRELTTIHTVTNSETGPRLRIRFNTEQPVTVPAPERSIEATLIRGSSESAFAFALDPAGDSSDAGAQTWVLRPTATQLQHGDTVRLRFSVSEIRRGGTVPLLVDMNVGDYTYVGYDGVQTVEVFHVVEIPPAGDGGGGGLTIGEVRQQVRELLQQVPTLPFVTITSIGIRSLNLIRSQVAEYELWFHLARRAESGGDLLRDLNVRVYIEVPDARTVVSVPIQNIDQEGPVHYTVQVSLNPLAEFNARQPTYARFVFPLDQGNRITTSDGDFNNIRAYMENLNITLDGSYIISIDDEGNEQEALVVYVRFDPLLLNRRDDQ